MNQFLIIEKGPGGMRIVDTGENFPNADQAVNRAKTLAQACKLDGVEYAVFHLVGGLRVVVDTFVETFFP